MRGYVSGCLPCPQLPAACCMGCIAFSAHPNPTRFASHLLQPSNPIAQPEEASEASKPVPEESKPVAATKVSAKEIPWDDTRAASKALQVEVRIQR